MKTHLSATLLAASLTLVGCDPKGSGSPAPAPVKKDKPAVVHDHGEGPHGGVIFDFGAHHAEFMVDHTKAECTVIILAGDDKTAKPLAVAAKELTLSTKATKSKEGKDVPALTITLKPVDEKDGKAMKFVGTNPGLSNVAEFEGSVAGSVDGKPSQGHFKE